MPILYREQKGGVDMAEGQELHEEFSFTYTYTYDQFVVFFYGGHVYLSGEDIPIGQCCVDVMNLEDAVLDEIDRRVGEFIPLAWALLTEKQTAPQLSHRRS